MAGKKKSFGFIGVLAAMLTLGISLSACSTNAKTTTKVIKVGAVSTLSGPIAANFKTEIPGVEAYFKYLNANGGANGHQITLAYNLNTGGNAAQFTADARQLIEQDHAFAVVGVGTAFFSSALFVQTKTPTYGWNVTGGWTGHPNLFASGGSVLDYTTLTPYAGYLAKKIGATTFGIVSYSLTASSAPCDKAATGLSKLGYQVPVTTFSISYPGSGVATEVEKMKAAGVNFIVSCMTTLGNIALAQAVKQYGLSAPQLFLDPLTPTVVTKYATVLDNSYQLITHVPFTATKKDYPGIGVYLSAMAKYEPKYVNSGLALIGWQAATLFAQGVKDAGKNVTPTSVIAADNKLTTYTAGGLIAPINWENAHTKATGPFCTIYEQIVGSKLKPVFNTNGQDFLCFGATGKTTPVTPKPSTPGAQLGSST